MSTEDERQLRDLITTVEAGIERTRRYLELMLVNEGSPRWVHDGTLMTADDKLDAQGRPILLDMQIRLLDARATLARICTDELRATAAAIPACRTITIGDLMDADCRDCGHNNLLHSRSEPCVACVLLGRTP